MQFSYEKDDLEFEFHSLATGVIALVVYEGFLYKFSLEHIFSFPQHSMLIKQSRILPYQFELDF